MDFLKPTCYRPQIATFAIFGHFHKNLGKEIMVFGRISIYMHSFCNL